MNKDINSFSVDFDNDEMSVRLIDDTTSSITTMKQAKDIAEEKGLDLILVSNSDIPVLKIGDYSKLEYERKKKQKGSDKKKDNTKEIRMRSNIAEHDIGIKAKQIDNFLRDGYKITITIIFKGRSVIRIRETGKELLDKLLSTVTEEYVAVRGVNFNSNNVMISISSKSNRR